MHRRRVSSTGGEPCDDPLNALQELEDENHILRKELDHQRSMNGDLSYRMERLEHEAEELHSTKSEPSENCVSWQHQRKIKELMKTFHEEEKAHDKSLEVVTMQLKDSKNQLAKVRASEQQYARQLAQAEQLIKQKQEAFEDLNATYTELQDMFEIQRVSSQQLGLKIHDLEEELEAEQILTRLNSSDETPMVHTRCSVPDRMGSVDLDRALCEDNLTLLRKKCSGCEALREELFETKSRMLQDCTDLRIRLEASEAALSSTDLNYWAGQAVKVSPALSNASLATTDVPTRLASKRSVSVQSWMDDEFEDGGACGLTPVFESPKSESPDEELNRKVKVGDVLAEFLEDDGSTMATLALEIVGVTFSGSYSGEACMNRKAALESVVQRLAAGLSNPQEQETAAEEKRDFFSEPEEELAPPPRYFQELMQQQQQQPTGVKKPADDAASVDDDEEHSVSRECLLRTVQTLQLECGQLTAQLLKAAKIKEAQAECDLLREENDNLKSQLSCAQQLEREHKFSLEQLRSSNRILERLMVADSGHHAPAVDMPGWPVACIEAHRESNALPLLRTTATVKSASSTYSSTHAELTTQIRELQEDCECLREELAAQTTASSSNEELSGLRREICDVRARLHVAQLAELDARKRADALPELVVKNGKLLKRLAEAEQNLREMRAVGGTNWSTFLSSFMCTAPEEKLHSTGVTDLAVGAGGLSPSCHGSC